MKNLKDSLEKLHNELLNAEEVDSESAEELKKLIDDIQKVLKRSAAIKNGSEEQRTMLEGLRESARKFDLTHPELAGAIRIVINSFSNIGA